MKTIRAKDLKIGDYVDANNSISPNNSNIIDFDRSCIVGVKSIKITPKGKYVIKFDPVYGSSRELVLQEGVTKINVFTKEEADEILEAQITKLHKEEKARYDARQELQKQNALTVEGLIKFLSTLPPETKIMSSWTDGDGESYQNYMSKDTQFRFEGENLIIE